MYHVVQEMSATLFTPYPSPTKRPTVSQVPLCETPPPLLKRQRLFSPSSPATPDKFPLNFQSPIRPSPRSFLLDSSSDSLTALNEMAVHQGNNGYDVMMTSPPRLERLQLLDYPRTPLSIARSSGLQVPASSSSGNDNPQNDNPQVASRKQNGHSGKAYSR